MSSRQGKKAYGACGKPALERGAEEGIGVARRGPAGAGFLSTGAETPVVITRSGEDSGMAETNHMFTIDLPGGWEDNTVFTFKGPHDGGVQHNIVLVVDPKVEKDISLADYARQQMNNARQFLPGFEMINEGEKTFVSGRQAYEVVYKYVPSDERVLFQKQTFMIIEGKGYIFTATFSKVTLKTIANEVDQIIATFVPASEEEE
jgi:hypothetical protein